MPCDILTRHVCGREVCVNWPCKSVWVTYHQSQRGFTRRYPTRWWLPSISERWVGRGSNEWLASSTNELVPACQRRRVYGFCRVSLRGKGQPQAVSEKS